MNKSIAIVGAGYAGLSAATQLLGKGYDINIYESDSKAGGLAKGIQFNGHDWGIEPYYHHWFYKEKDILALANSHGIGDLVNIYSPNTSFYLNGNIKPFDRPHHILSYPDLSIIDRYNLGKSLGMLRISSNWKDYEKITAEKWLIEKMGLNVYKKIWKPMLIGKWGEYYNQINMAWFWARIYVRTQKLMYPKGGFQNFTDKIVKKLSDNGVNFFFNTKIDSLKKNQNNRIEIILEKEKKYIYDKALLTVSPKLFNSIVQDQSINYKNQIDSYRSMGAICALLVLKKKTLRDTYWLNIPAHSIDASDNEIPFLVFVEHTNMIPTKHYGNNHIVYCGNYVSLNSPLLQSSNEEIISMYLKGIKKINPMFKEDDIIDFKVSRTDYASPVFEINHSKIIPNIKTPIENLYWASMSHVYPWDRGTNYAVKIGSQAANLIIGNGSQNS